MTTWSLPQLLAGLHDSVHARLQLARVMGHPVSKGDASEAVWLEMLQKYLPQRYTAARAFVVDSLGAFSDQMDVVIFDRQYSPFIFEFEGQTMVPAESVYAVFEFKQSINAGQVTYAQDKVESVRKPHRTSLPVPHVGGVAKPKPLHHILGGLLTFDSDWNPPMGGSLATALAGGQAGNRLDLGCIARHGMFTIDSASMHLMQVQDKAATTFLFELIAQLQSMATVPMIDIRAYAAWLTGPPGQAAGAPTLAPQPGSTTP